MRRVCNCEPTFASSNEIWGLAHSLFGFQGNIRAQTGILRFNLTQMVNVASKVTINMWWIFNSIIVLNVFTFTLLYFVMHWYMSFQISFVIKSTTTIRAHVRFFLFMNWRNVSFQIYIWITFATEWTHSFGFLIFVMHVRNMG